MSDRLSTYNWTRSRSCSVESKYNCARREVSTNHLTRVDDSVAEILSHVVRCGLQPEQSSFVRLSRKEAANIVTLAARMGSFPNLKF